MKDPVMIAIDNHISRSAGQHKRAVAKRFAELRESEGARSVRTLLADTTRGPLPTPYLLDTGRPNSAPARSVQGNSDGSLTERPKLRAAQATPAPLRCVKPARAPRDLLAEALAKEAAQRIERNAKRERRAALLVIAGFAVALIGTVAISMLPRGF